MFFECHTYNIIMPTWFCHRDVMKAGLSSKGHAGTVEDLIFFHQHLDDGFPLRKVQKDLVVYRQHPGQISVSSVPYHAILEVKLNFLVRHLLEKVTSFVIWYTYYKVILYNHQWVNK